MTTWKQNSEEVKVIDLPFCKQMVIKSIALSLTPSGYLQNAFLYTDPYYAGIVSAKLSTQDEYMTVGAYSTTPSCFLGDLAASIEVDVDFEILFAEVSDSEQIIPISVGYGEGILPRVSDFWHKDTTETPFFWYEEEEEVSDFWRERDFLVSVSTLADIATDGDMIYEDIKGTIGYWYKTSSGKGYFKTASDGTEVILGD